MPTDTPDTGLEVRADSLAHGGEAVCRTDEGVVFVPGLLPGETARIRIDFRKKRFARGTVLDLLEPAAHRQAPACPAAAAGAGCCDLAVTDATTAAALKAQVATDQFARLGGITSPLVDDLRAQQLQPQPAAAHLDPSEAAVAQQPMRRWRTVARWHVGADGRLGTFAAGSHDVVTEARCTQVVAELDALAAAVDASGCLPVGAELVARASFDGAVCAAWREPTVGERSGAGRRATQRRRAAAARRPQWRALPGELGIPDTGPAGDGTFTWELPATAFWQPHRQAVASYQRHVAAALAELTAEGVDTSGPTTASDTGGRRALTVWDLYAGVGALTWTPLAAIADQGWQIRLHQVETAPEACEAARAAHDQLPPGMHSQIHQQSVARWLANPPRDHAQPSGPDLVVADPPRSGLEPDVIGRLAALRPRQIVHIGCDIAAAARDVGALVRSGFALRTVTVVDAFPGTHHAEVVTRLSYPA